MDYVRTWSSFRSWREVYPNEKKREDRGREKDGGIWEELVCEVKWRTEMLFAKEEVDSSFHWLVTHRNC